MPCATPCTVLNTPSFFHSAQCSSVKIETHDHYYGINATINSPHDRAQHDATEIIHATAFTTYATQECTYFAIFTH